MVEGGWQKIPRLVDGYDVVTWLVVLNLGCSGLLVSWIMKYADNIVKVCECFKGFNVIWFGQPINENL